MYTYSFEKLEVWKLSKVLAVKIYSLTNSFPTGEKYGMISQLRRASVSVSSNIAEGSSRTSKKEQAHFYTMAYGSLIEVLNQLLISFELKWIKEADLNDVRIEIECLSRQLNSLRNYLFKSIDNK